MELGSKTFKEVNMVIKDICQSYLHSAIAVVLGIMGTGDHKVDWTVYFKWL